MSGLALFHGIHRNLGPDGPSAFKCGLCGSIVVDVRVDVGRFFVAEGRACRGQVKSVALIFLLLSNRILYFYLFYYYIYVIRIFII